LADAESRARFGLGLAARTLLEFAKTQPRPYSINNLSACGPDYWEFKRRWPRMFVRIEKCLWQAYNGDDEPILPPWQFREFDALCIDGAWRYASDNVCVLYDTRGPGDRYWLCLARVIDATTHPARRVRELLGDWLPPPLAMAA
jgi:hypothetical protein